jgi:hypothetical protein
VQDQRQFPISLEVLKIDKEAVVNYDIHRLINLKSYFDYEEEAVDSDDGFSSSNEDDEPFDLDRDSFVSSTVISMS